MDRCISHQETSARSVNHHHTDDTPSPWDRFDVADNTSFTVRRRSTSPAASTFALSPLSSPCSSFHGDDLGSPDAGDDTGSNPVETLSSLYINDTVRSRRSLGSNASSQRSSSSNGSAGSSSSWAQQLPSFHRPLKFVSRPPDLAFGAVPTMTMPEDPAPRRRNRRHPSMVVEDADKAAFEQLVGQRRVRKSFMFGKKSGNSRQAINSILTTSGAYQESEDELVNSLFWLDQPVLPPVDYAQTVSARSAQGWQVGGQLKSIPLLPRPRASGERGPKDGDEPLPDGKQSPVDVEMSSKPPSRESSFRGEEAQTVQEAGGSGGTSAGGETSHDVGTSAQGSGPVKVENTGGSGGGGGGVETGGSGARPAGGNVDSKKRVYGCTVPDCGKVYTKSSHLKSHMRSHTGKCSRLTTLCLKKRATYLRR